VRREAVAELDTLTLSAVTPADIGHAFAEYSFASAMH
jgi:hypothetical protein